MKEYEFNWLQIPFAIFFISLIWIVTYTLKESEPTTSCSGNGLRFSNRRLE